MKNEQRSTLRNIFRDVVTVGFIGLTLPLWVASWLERLLGRSETIFVSCSEFLSLIPGPIGIFCRRGFYVMALDHCSWDVGFGFGTILAHREVRVGRRVSCGHYCTIGMAVFEDDVMLGSNVDLLSGRRQHYTDDPDRRIQDQGGTFTPVRIGRNCWIGNSAVVMADVGPGAVVGAGSVVVKPIPPMTIAAGNPARVIRRRSGESSEATFGVSQETP